MGYVTRNVASTFGWFMQRVTALFLACGLLVHFWVLHFAIERPVTFEKVQARLLTSGWVFFDLLLLTAAVYHAMNGVWNVLTDYNPAPVWRKIIGWTLTVIGVAMVLYGYHILMPFTVAGGVQ